MTAWLTSMLTNLAWYFAKKFLAWGAALAKFTWKRKARENQFAKDNEETADKIEEIISRPPPATEEERAEREKELDDAQRDGF